MPEPFAPSRIPELVGQARKALILRARLAHEGQDPGEVDAVLEGLYRDIGRAVVAASESGALIPDAPPLPTENFTDELPADDDDDDWYTDEQPRVDGSLFDPDELEDETDVPEADAPPPREDTDPGGGSFVVETTTTMAQRARDDHASGLAQLANGVPSSWGPVLAELLDLISLPQRFDDPAELTVEASRVQWAASEIEYRLADQPDDLRICLIALLAARAQHLRTQLDVDAGIRASLDHLQRYRVEQGLPSVPALLPTPRPEHGGWEADVRAWWALLRPSTVTQGA